MERASCNDDSDRRTSEVSVARVSSRSSRAASASAVLSGRSAVCTNRQHEPMSKLRTRISSLFPNPAKALSISVLKPSTSDPLRSGLTNPSTILAPSPGFRFVTFGPTCSFGNRASKIDTASTEMLTTQWGVRMYRTTGGKGGANATPTDRVCEQ